MTAGRGSSGTAEAEIPVRAEGLTVRLTTFLDVTLTTVGCTPRLRRAYRGIPADALMGHLAHPSGDGFLIVDAWSSENAFRAWWRLDGGGVRGLHLTPGEYEISSSVERRRHAEGGAKNSRAMLSGSRKDRPEP